MSLLCLEWIESRGFGWVMAAALLNPSPFFPRAEQSGAHGVLYHRAAVSTCCHASPSKDLVFVVNPKGGSGRTGREWKKLLPHVKTCVGQQCNVHELFTSSPSQAVDITREAIRNGVDAVIAVGGDGTLHEVVNGFFWAGKPVRSLDRSSGHVTALGLIPLGTGSDFARTFDWKNDPHEAVKRIAKGLRSKIDIGLITGSGGEHHYFINEADIHLSARGGYYSSMYKPFGNFCYILAGLRAFIGHRNLDFKMKVDDEDWKVYEKVTTLCIGNGKFFGGGMKIVPNADPYNGKLEVVLLQEFKWYDFLFRLYKLYIGSHLSEPNVHSMGVQSIEVAAAEEGQGEIFVQSDGEHFGFLPIKCSILPAAIDFLA